MVKSNKFIWIGALVGLMFGIIINISSITFRVISKGPLSTGLFGTPIIDTLANVFFFVCIGIIVSMIIHFFRFHSKNKNLELKRMTHTLLHVILWIIFITVLFSNPHIYRNMFEDISFILGILTISLIFYLGSGILFDNLVNFYNKREKGFGNLFRFFFMAVAIFLSIILNSITWVLIHEGVP